MTDKAIELLENVPDKYDDFIIGMKAEIKNNYEIADAIIKFIEEDPARTTSDILGYLWEIDGRELKPLEIVDDEEAA